MPKSIEGTLAAGGRIVDDAWTYVDAREALDAAPGDAAVLASLALWRTDRDALTARQSPLGLQLPNDTDPASIADDLHRFSLVAIEFPKFTDGRGYSIARLLRERHGYRGSLRAVGDVLRDQLFYMLRCGFDSFVMKHDDRIDDALVAFRDFSEGYQSSVERPVPLFKRRYLEAGHGAA